MGCPASVQADAPARLFRIRGLHSGVSHIGIATRIPGVSAIENVQVLCIFRNDDANPVDVCQQDGGEIFRTPSWKSCRLDVPDNWSASSLDDVLSRLRCGSLRQ